MTARKTLFPQNSPAGATAAAGAVLVAIAGSDLMTLNLVQLLVRRGVITRDEAAGIASETADDLRNRFRGGPLEAAVEHAALDFEGFAQHMRSSGKG